jgi:hypothetical protein
MAVPYTFGTATASIPLSQLDSNFATTITLGNTAIQLGNTVTTLNNMTLANVTVNSGNVTLTNVSVTTANVTTGNVTTLAVGSGGITSTGNVGVGTTSTTTKLTISANATLPGAGAPSGTNLWIVGAGSANHYLLMDNFASSPQFSGRRSQGTSGSPTAVLSGNNLAIFSAFGYGATGYSSSTRADIKLAAAETWTDSAQGTFVAFSNTPIGSAALTERMRLDSTGNLGIGTSSPDASAILDAQSTTKGVRFPNMTTAQKTAITPAAGTVVFDTTLAKLCVYSGSAWQTITSV